MAASEPCSEDDDLLVGKVDIRLQRVRHVSHSMCLQALALAPACHWACAAVLVPWQGL